MDVNATLGPRDTSPEVEAGKEADEAASPLEASNEERHAASAVPTADPTDTVEPAVSAIVVTYNHERYIGQALDGVLSQKTDFPFEVIVSEDRSTDDTAEIVEGYAKRYPDQIRFMRSDVNLRDNEVLLRAMRAARGRYVTFLDGDDYWVSANKLQAQFDFMEANPDSAVTYHDVERVTDDGEVIRVMKGIGHRGTIQDLLKGNFVGTCSVMIRRSTLPEVPEWVRGMPAADWPLYFLAARSGFVDHIEGIVSRYRIHGESFWATRPLPEQLLIGFCMQVEIEAHLGPDYAPLFERSRRELSRHILSTVLKQPPVRDTDESPDAEPAPRQPDAVERTHRIRLVEMETRINEAEAKRSEAQWRADNLTGRLHEAEASRDEAWRHAGNLATQMANSQAAIADVMARHWEALAELNRSQAQAQSAESHGRELQDALDAAQRAVGNAEARSLELQDTLEAAHRQLKASGIDRHDLQSAVEASTARVRRLRRREKRIGIGLSLVIAALAAIIIYMQWF